MTGYGKGNRVWRGKKISMEIKCVNSKVLDATWRWSGPYRELEHELRGLVADRLQRGKVEVVVTVRNEVEDASRFSELQTGFLDKAYRQFSQWCAGQDGLSGEAKAWLPAVLGQALAMQPDAWRKPEEAECGPEELAAAAEELRGLTDEVLTAVDRFRVQVLEMPTLAAYCAS